MGSQKRSLNDAYENTAELGRRDRRLRSSYAAGKVFTSKGIRARRLRLSAPTAIQFYDVQDRLGCERATEAVDWLLQNAKSAIDALSEPLETDGDCRKQNFSFPTMATSVPSSSSSQFQSYPLQNFSQKGNFSVLSPMILNASPTEFSGQEPPSSVSQSNVGTDFPSLPMWEQLRMDSQSFTRRRNIDFKSTGNGF